MPAHIHKLHFIYFLFAYPFFDLPSSSTSAKLISISLWHSTYFICEYEIYYIITSKVRRLDIGPRTSTILL